MEAAFKTKVHQLVDELPADATVDDLLTQLLELRSIERGLADRSAGRLTPHEEAYKIVMDRIRNSASA